MRQSWVHVVVLLLTNLMFVISEADAIPAQTQDSELREGLEVLANMVMEQAQTQELLKNRLEEETAKRVALETLLQSVLQEKQQNVSHLQGFNGEMRDSLLQGTTLQQQITLLQDAQVSDEETLQELTKKMVMMEGEVEAVSLLNSRLRELEERLKMMERELISNQNSIHQTRRGLERQKRDLRRLGSSFTDLARSHGEVVTTTHALTRQLADLHHACLAVMEEATEEEEQLKEEVETRSVQLNETVVLVQQQITNLTEMVTMLQLQGQQDVPLLLCPQPYRKVGGQCLQLLDEPLTWDEARTTCGNEGIVAGGIGDLVTPSDMNAFRTHIYHLQTGVKYAWVGARREEELEEWQWVSGVRLGHAPGQVNVPWDLGEPDNTPEQRHLCVKMSGNVKFHDCTSNAALPAICQLS